MKRFLFTLCVVVFVASIGFSLTVGVNLPWVNYGWDIGRNPWNEIIGDGFSKHPDLLRAKLRTAKQHRMDVVRVFLFADCRSGFVLEEGTWRLDRFALKDIRTLFVVARDERVQIIPVLFDWMMADGKAIDGKSMGEHPEFVVSPKIRQQIYSDLVPVFALFEEYRDIIYTWESFNEPDHAFAINASWNGQVQLYGFLTDIAALGKEHAPSVRSTIGSATSEALVSKWNFIPQDELQFHYYFSGDLRMPPQANTVSTNRTVFIGEFQCSKFPALQLNWARQSGYPLVVFWSLSGHDNLNVDLEAIKQWQDSTQQSE